MIELKVQCVCGQKFKFDVEPQNGQVPFPVACPHCGTDAADRANALLAQMPEYAAAQAAAPVAQPALRINRVAPETPPPALPSASTQPRPGIPRRAAQSTGSEQYGTVGAIGGALFGLLLWYLMFRPAGGRFEMFRGPDNVPAFILVIGLLSGIAAWLFGGRRMEQTVGKAAAICTALIVLGGQFLFVYVTFKSIGFTNNPFLKVDYGKAFLKSFDATTIICGVVAMAIAFVSGAGLFVKLIPPKTRQQ